MGEALGRSFLRQQGKITTKGFKLIGVRDAGARWRDDGYLNAVTAAIVFAHQ